ncbi:MAG: hypothetical protein HY720_14210 [Planctomycetes bacterium]|nr:hypothetical protein [Planctomycetota bacterium]
MIAWFRAEQACLAVKKAVVAVGSGCERIFLASLEDWPGSPWAFHGLVDQRGDPKPVFNALSLLFQTLEGYERVEALDLGEAGIRTFRFALPGGETIVLWADDRVLQTWETPPAEPRRVRLPLARRGGRWTRIPTAKDEETRWTGIAAGQDFVALEIGETPVLVEAGR